MTANESTPRKPLRLWPGVIAASLLVLGGYVVPVFVPDWAGYGMMGAVAGALIIILWWLLFSRARWYERLGALVVMIAALFPEHYVVHPSISGGAMGYMAYFLTIPTLCVALVAWAAVSRRLSVSARGAAAVAAVVIGCLPWTLVRTGGIAGSGKSDLHWRWTPTPEERLLAQAREEPVAAPSPAAVPVTPAPASVAAAVTSADKTPAPTPPVPERPAIWPGFRGPNRDGVIHGAPIETDWAKSPPVELWRRKVGPGWSSFAVRGDLIYTQEQRGEDEDVSCYNLTTGKLVWRHRDAARFWESNAGAGPRGTPTVINGRVYTLGATESRTPSTQYRRGRVAQRAVRHRRDQADLGLLELSPGGRRYRHRRRLRTARRLRCHHRQSSLVRTDRRWELQLAAPDDDRRRAAGPDAERLGRDQRHAGHRQGAVEARMGRRPHSATRPDG
jgi:outer membrane protein assembly factor BamB